MKLCSLKDVIPGSVVEVPAEYRTQKGELGLLMDMEYDHIHHVIHAELYRKAEGEFKHFTLASLKEDDSLLVAEESALEKEFREAFRSGKHRIPECSMTSGCDPEIFVADANGVVIPAWEFMPSEDEARAKAKEWLAAPYLIEDGKIIRSSGKSMGNPSDVNCPWAVPSYWDGVQAEFSPWAKGCLEALHHGTRLGLEAVLGFARKKDAKAKLMLDNVVALSETVLRDSKDEHIQFRCTPSYNVYNDPGMGIPDARTYKYRCSGGHIHVGPGRKFTAPGIEQIVRGLDAVLGVAGVSLAAGIDNAERRHTYGRAGEFRLPKHGVEYRVLSNFWLCHPAVAMLVFEIARTTVRFAESGFFRVAWDAEEGEIRDVINFCDVEGARAILKRNFPSIKRILLDSWPVTVSRGSEARQKMVERALKALMQGVGEVIKDPAAIESNWKLNDPEEWQRHCHGTDCSWKNLAVGKSDWVEVNR